MSKHTYEDAIKGVVKDLVVEGLEYKIEKTVNIYRGGDDYTSSTWVNLNGHTFQGYNDGMEEPASTWVTIDDNKVLELCVKLYGKNAGTVICNDLFDNDIESWKA